MKDHLIFDTTDAQSILDSDSVGAFVRANDGSLITKHSLGEAVKASLISQGLLFKAKLSGAIGNTYSFTVVDDAIAGPMTYTEVGGDIIVDLHANTPTPAQLVTLLMTTTPNSYVDVTAGSPTANVVVAAQADLTGGENTNFHKYLDVYSATADGSGNPITSTGGSLNVNMTNTPTFNVDIDGIYNVGTNPNPDNAGLIAHTRAAAPGDAEQVERTTSAIAGSSGIVANTFHGLDTNSALLALNGSGTLDSIKATTNALWVNVQNTISVNDAALALTSMKSRAETGAAALTSKNVVSAPLTDRKYLYVYNNDNQKIFIGGAGVLVTDGFPISPGSYMELRAGAAVDVEFVSSKTSAAIRTLEIN